MFGGRAVGKYLLVGDVDSLESVTLDTRAIGTHLRFEQLYPDNTRTEWTCVLDQSCQVPLMLALSTVV
jgi:hypothetical protein